MSAQEKVLSIAIGEIGYLEKKTNSKLDSKTENAGMNNYTKYARDVDTYKVCGYSLQAQPWCACFVFWCLIKAFGFATAKQLIGLNKSVYNIGSCTQMVQLYKANNCFYKTDPKPGDQIFFAGSGTNVYKHTGVVEKIANGKVYTIEGNTSGASGVIDNGGGVCRKSYSLTSSSIGGYGRLKWELVKEKEEDDMTKDQVIKIMEEQMATQMEKYQANLAAKAGGDATALEWAKKAGIMMGNAQGNQMPLRLANRNEIVLLLYRFAKWLGKA